MALGEKIGSRFPKGHPRKIVQGDLAIPVPDDSLSPSLNEKMAMRGMETSESPSKENPFVTADDIRLSYNDPLATESETQKALGDSIIFVGFVTTDLEIMAAEYGHRIISVDTTDGAFEIYLHAASLGRKELQIRNTGANSITVFADGDDLIEGEVSVIIEPGDTLHMMSDGVVSWEMLSFVVGDDSLTGVGTIDSPLSVNVATDHETTPQWVGQICVDAGVFWIAGGTASAADWKRLTITTPATGGGIIND